jgi:hypothetical protein
MLFLQARGGVPNAIGIEAGANDGLAHIPPIGHALLGRIVAKRTSTPAVGEPAVCGAFGTSW